MKFWTESQHKYRIIAFALISLFGLYLLVAWASYSPWDNSWSMANSSLSGVINKAGAFGAWTIDLCNALLGRIAFLIPFTFSFAPLYLILAHKSNEMTLSKFWYHSLAFFLFLTGLAACTHFLFTDGGALGGLFFSLLSSLLGDLIALLFSVLTLVIGFYFCSGQTIFHLTTNFFHWVTEDPEATKNEVYSESEENRLSNEDNTVTEYEQFAHLSDSDAPYAADEKQSWIPDDLSVPPTITNPDNFVAKRPTIVGLNKTPKTPDPTSESEIIVTLPQDNSPVAPTFNPNNVVKPELLVSRSSSQKTSIPSVSLSEETHSAITENSKKSSTFSVSDDEPLHISIQLPQDLEDIEEIDKDNDEPVNIATSTSNEENKVHIQLESAHQEIATQPQSIMQAEKKAEKNAKPTYPKGYGSSLLHPLLAQQENIAKPTTPLPTLDLLSVHSQNVQQESEQEILSISKRIEIALADFKIKASVEDVLVGPVVTRYEVLPAPGIKASRIVGLAPDLARYLMVKAIRITDFVPGKPYIGVEIPNKQRETVWLRDVFATNEFRQSKMTLPMALGQDISGKPVIVDMETMPHLLVAGQTGGGKSVGINTMILSLLYKRTPDELRFIMIDPKATELSIYNDIPHLLTPVVTDMKKAENALRWAVEEMERRYLLLTALKVRNIEGFNAKLRQADEEYGIPIPNPIWKPGDTMDTLPPPLEKMNYIVLVVDEFADLLMVAGKQVESYIMRIAQKARAAGIHLILATQRPSTDVITGVIKANIPSRIAFTVASQFDSRTILGTGGAENLLGRGDMLFSASGSPEIIRVHGAYMTDADVENVANDWRARGTPNYMESILESNDENENDTEHSNQDNLDPLFDEIAAFVIETQKVSASLIQRRFSIGYNRAARIVEQLEAQGIISAPNSRNIREVLAR